MSKYIRYKSLNKISNKYYMKNIVIFMVNDFDIKCGGIVVQYYLSKQISELNYNIQMISPTNVKNSIFNNFLLDTTIDIENTIVIYGETIQGNPLNAKYVVRWILAPLGLVSQKNIYQTWGSEDLVYYFNSESKFNTNPEKIGNVYKLLTTIYLNPLATNINPTLREGYCHTFRKSYYHKSFTYFHPSDSFELTSELTQEELISHFNKYKYFITYDPLTFLSVIAALCGCISIVYKVDGISKEEWLSNTGISEYIKEKKINTLYGIAYGLEDIPFAESTLHLAKEQWDDIIDFIINKNIKPFIEDMENYENLINTVKNNYFE